MPSLLGVEIIGFLLALTLQLQLLRQPGNAFSKFGTWFGMAGLPLGLLGWAATGSPAGSRLGMCAFVAALLMFAIAISRREPTSYLVDDGQAFINFLSAKENTTKAAPAKPNR